MNHLADFSQITRVWFYDYLGRFAIRISNFGLLVLLQNALVRSSNSVAPSIFRNEPFGGKVEGLSHCWVASCRFKIVFK